MFARQIAKEQFFIHSFIYSFIQNWIDLLSTLFLKARVGYQLDYRDESHLDPISKGLYSYKECL